MAWLEFGRGQCPALVPYGYVQQVPGRKTDIADAHWLAIGEKNRLHKLLTDAGIRLSVVVSDVYGKSARAMIRSLLNGETPEQLLAHADPRLKASPDELRDAWDGNWSGSHRFVIRELMAHLDELDARIQRFRQTLLNSLSAYPAILQPLQTLPGIDELSAALLLVEIGDDLNAFGSPAKLASWAGVCPGQNESAGKRESTRTRKGNPYLRRILCEAANAASRTRCGLQEKLIQYGYITA